MGWFRPSSWRPGAPHLNGLTVALGVLVVQALVAAVAGLPAGLAASGGAVCTSLPDVPNPAARTWRRVLPAALFVVLVTAVVGLVRPHPLAMVGLVFGLGFVSLLFMAWGPRAGTLSFSGTLALVFAMAWDAPATPQALGQHVLSVAAGAGLYAAWALASSWALRRRYRELALALALQAFGDSLRSRATRIGTLRLADQDIRQAMLDDSAVADALQAARDQIFAARPSPHSLAQRATLLRLIELRDLMLASRLDLELLGQDGPAQAWRQALASTLLALARRLDDLAEAVRRRQPLAAQDAAPGIAALAAAVAAVPVAADDRRRGLVRSLQSRMGQLLTEVAAMAPHTGRHAAVDHDDGWTREQLQRFVSPEGWPLAALKPHLHLESPVMRHALRGGLAMACAYALGEALPWATHPHWLVLSVAVVLRGSLEQTLSRRNARLSGTVLGCLLVLAVVQAQLPHVVLAGLFLVAVGVAHAYLNLRYRVTATAASVMALLQPLLLSAQAHPAIAERLADTVMGAGLAWAFCFVLPSWERRTLGRLGQGLPALLAQHAANVLVALQPSREQQLAQRLSRQQVYTLLASVAAAAQRNRAEPRAVRAPEAELEALLSHGYRMMALLGAVQQSLARLGDQLDPQQIGPALTRTRAACVAALRPPTPSAPGASPALAEPTPAEDPTVDLLPADAGEVRVVGPWVLRRLRLCRQEARLLAQASQALLGALHPR